MKKLFFVAMAAVAMTFTACQDKPAPAPAPEEETPEVELVSTDSIAAVIEAADSTQLSTLLTEAQSKIEELKNIDPAKAKEYLAAIQNLLKENAEKIKAFAGTGAVATLVDAVNNLPAIEVPDVAAAAEEAVENAGDAVKDAAEGAVEDVKEATGDAAQAAADKVEEVKDAAADKAAEAVDNAADKLKGALGK
ncbi:MAG: hypothetical protein IKI36_08035 [Prevotella sp.]|nr:hypothetical protein [Prevotella sp.]